MSDSDGVERNVGAIGLWRMMVDRRVSVLVIVFLCTLAAAAAALFMKPVYRATVVLVPAESTNPIGSGLTSMLGDLGGLASLAGLALKSDETTVESIALLESRQFTESFIRDNGLLARLYRNRWDAEHSRWRVHWWSDAPTVYDAYRRFDRKIRRVVEDKKTGVVTLDIDWTDAEEGARWANELVRRLNEAMRSRAIAEADQSIALLTTESSGTDVAELKQAIARLIEAQLQVRTLANVRSDYAFRVVDPAAPPGHDDFVRPQRALYLVLGPIIGLMIAAGFVVICDLAAQMRKHLKTG